jgi:hypothetical protein
MKVKWKRALWFSGMLYYEALRPTGSVFAEVYNVDRLIGWDHTNLFRTNWWVIKPVVHMLNSDRLHPTLKAAKRTVEDYATGKKKFGKKK